MRKATLALTFALAIHQAKADVSWQLVPTAVDEPVSWLPDFVITLPNEVFDQGSVYDSWNPFTGTPFYFQGVGPFPDPVYGTGGISMTWDAAGNVTFEDITFYGDVHDFLFIDGSGYFAGDDSFCGMEAPRCNFSGNFVFLGDPIPEPSTAALSFLALLLPMLRRKKNTDV